MSKDARRRRRPRAGAGSQPAPAPAAPLAQATVDRIAAAMLAANRGTSAAATVSPDDGRQQLVIDDVVVGTVRPLRRTVLLQTDRIELTDGTSLFWKRTVGPLRAETATLAALQLPYTAAGDTAADMGATGDGVVGGDGAALAVPTLLATARDALADGLLLQDLGLCPSPLPRHAWPTIVHTLHTTRVPAGMPVVDEASLASLPARALGHLDALRAEGVGRWPDSDRIAADLEFLRRLGRHRSSGATLAPYGLCHGSFDPAALFPTPDGRVYVLGWGWAHRGPGLLDLLGSLPLGSDGIADAFDAHDEVLDAYRAAGGDPAAEQDRAGLPATRWAAGWSRVVQAERLLGIVAGWLDQPDDFAAQHEVGTLLHEAVQCLR